MKMVAGQRALDKMYRRRDRYEIPDWQREEVWDTPKKQQLIDSILRGWKLPKFYFVKYAEDEYEVVDGQQRLSAIYEFSANELQISPQSAQKFGGLVYRDLPQRNQDAFDDFEIEYDEIEEASEAELKDFFQRLQQGLPLTSSEKLNAVHSNLRNYCRNLAAHPFLRRKVSVPDTRYAHFDIVAKAAAVEIEGLDAGLRFDDLKRVFEEQAEFSTTSATGKRLKAALDLLAAAFPSRDENLTSRTLVQSLITLACRLVHARRVDGLKSALGDYVRTFVRELSEQVELGQSASDADYMRFQRSVNANIRSGPRTRHEILVRKLFLLAPKLAETFGPMEVRESGVEVRIRDLGASIGNLIGQTNETYSSKNGEDLFKATNRTAQAIVRMGHPVTDLTTFGQFIDDLYFLLWESVGERLAGTPLPSSFADVNLIRTGMRHDVDHGGTSKVRAKRKKIGAAFVSYAGRGTPETVGPETLLVAQAGLLTEIEGDIQMLASKGVHPELASPSTSSGS